MFKKRQEKKKREENLRLQNDFALSQKRDNEELSLTRKETPELVNKFFPKNKELVPEDINLLKRLREDFIKTGVLEKEIPESVFPPSENLANILNRNSNQIVKDEIPEEDDEEFFKNEFDESRSMVYDNVIEDVVDHSTDYHHISEHKEVREELNNIISSGENTLKEVSVKLPDGTIVIGKLL